jgi:AcrR family transcriptional regulator
MIADTRDKLIASARLAFATKGYAESSMDDFTADAGLTRGALYHHFGDKKGLLQAVITQIDAEMSARLDAITRQADTRWQGFVDECVAYLHMALEPEIQRIMLLDGPAVLGDPSQWDNQTTCIRATTVSLQQLMDEGVIRTVDPEAMARLLSGATLGAALWIAGSREPQAALTQSVDAFRALAEGLLLKTPNP